jgi:SOS response regulatory protein OraA/RecX
VLDTGSMTIEEGVARIIEYLEEEGYLSLGTAPEAAAESQSRTGAGR